MVNPAQFPYTTLVTPQGGRLLRPILPIQLTYGQQHLNGNALLDSGADANVLPYQVGLALGANWNEAHPIAGLSGNLAQTEARAIALELTLSPFDPVWMVFMWVKTDEARLLLGQINFFQEFDCAFLEVQCTLKFAQRTNFLDYSLK